MKGGAILYGFFLLAFTSCQRETSFISFDDQLAGDLALIDNFLATNGINAELDSTQRLRYTIMQSTAGRRPVLVDSVRVKYSTYQLNGSRLVLIDEVVDKPLPFLVNNFITGWKKIVPLMGEGSRFTIYVPSGLAYGSYQQGKVPPNSNLVFEVELVKVIPEFTRQLAKDAKTVDQYLAANNLTARIDASGLRYQILNTGSGPVVSTTDSVTLTYVGKFFDQTIFDQLAIPKKYALNKTLRAWQTGLLQLQKGGVIRLYSPSGLAFGAYGSTATQIPVLPATNVIYELTLVDIKKN
ncbi:MAG: FKBP-type peptidyl-prolyl cis-trans isomerase [Flammeovirgaceae bacterium]